MRILHVTDFHFRQQWYDWLALHAHEYDAVCFTGDLLTIFTTPMQGLADARATPPTGRARQPRAPNLAVQARWVRDWLKNWPATTPLFLCSGNHDYWPQQEHFIDTDAEGGWLRKTRRPLNIWAEGGESALIDGYRFLCVPWARIPKTTTTEPVVALVHAPPAGTDISSGLAGEAGGDVEVAEATRELPGGSFLLCGHVHHPRHWFTSLRCRSSGEAIWGFNPGLGAADAVAPNFIVLDTEARRAEFHGPGAILPQNLESVSEK